MAAKVGDRLGDRLVASKLLPRDLVERAASQAKLQKKHLGEILVKHGDLSEHDLFHALAGQGGLMFVPLERILPLVDPDVAHRTAPPFLKTHDVFPFARDGIMLHVATCDPFVDCSDVAKAHDARTVTRWLLVPPDFRKLRDIVATLPKGSKRNFEEHAAAGDEPPPEEVAAVLDRMLGEAVQARASDIHFELYANQVRVRMRIDGDLRDDTKYHLDGRLHRWLVNVVKIRSDLDIAERRLPQGGRFSITVAGHPFDVRAQTQPSLHGEHVVLRLLRENVQPKSMEDLGFTPRIAASYRRGIASPNGLILVVGPTGSGKSTTLYAGLQMLARDSTRKVITIEDPIEYSIQGIQQTQVNRAVGFDFADAMRVFVRQDPDAILIGEIRDAETALEAIRASQTGHLVLSTLHCNDSVDAVQRLFDLGMHANSIASELLTVYAQRLAKRICSGCRALGTPRPELVAEIFPYGMPKGFVTFAGAGCDACGGDGTFERIAVVELLPVSAELRRAISRRLPLDDLRAVARGSGLIPLIHQALEMVYSGLITLEELPSILNAEALVWHPPSPATPSEASPQGPPLSHPPSAS
ncbi:MAG: type II/IV secretion system protein [Deltaproteobacteria bacterium]|nr:type II/IV secretion system protein [Deltaproteobacteria bacterium]